MCEKAEDAQAVCDADEDDALLGEACAVVRGDTRHTADKTPAVDPYHHRQFVARSLRRSPHIQIQAILLDGCRGTEDLREVRVLHAARPVLSRLLHTGPRLDRLRRYPAQRSNGRRSEGDALE